MRKVLAIALTIVFVLTLATPFSASDMKWDITYDIKGDIDIEKQIGHYCNTGAQFNQVIEGEGEMSKSMETVQIKGKLAVDDTQDWVTAEDAVRNLTVTSAIKLCAPPKTGFTTTRYTPVEAPPIEKPELPEGMGGISGTVRLEEEPVEGAIVTAVPNPVPGKEDSTETDENGFYLLEPLLEGIYEVQVDYNEETRIIPGIVVTAGEINEDNNIDFADDPVPPTYTLTLEADPAEGGTVTDNTDAGQYAAGTEVSVTAEANAGYKFTNWTVGVTEVSSGASFIYTMPAEDVTLTANFEEDEDVTISYDAGTGGIVDPTSEALAPATGVAQGSTATPDSGYSFVNWTDSDNEIVGTDPLFVPEKVDGLNVEATYTANFEETLVPTYFVDFKVTDDDDPAGDLDGANIAVFSNSERTEQVGTTQITDSVGEATLDVELEDGTYYYTVTLTGYDAIEGEFIVSSINKTVAIMMSEVPAPTYSVTRSEVVGGTATVEADPGSNIPAGETVTITISNIESSKRFDSIVVERDNSGEFVVLTEVTEGSVYAFVMPADDVTVTVTLEDITDGANSVTLTGDETVTSNNEIESGTYTAELDVNLENVPVFFSLTGDFVAADVESVSTGVINDLFQSNGGGLIVNTDANGEAELTITFAAGVDKSGALIAAIDDGYDDVGTADSDTLAITVDTTEKAPAFFAPSISAPDTAEINVIVYPEFAVENTGDQAGTKQIRTRYYDPDGETDSASVRTETISGGQTWHTTGAKTFDRSGSWTIELSTDDDTATHEIEIVASMSNDVSTTVEGGTATVVATPSSDVQIGETVTVAISDIQEGKQFVSIVVSSDFTGDEVSTSEEIEGGQYTFAMPAEDVTVTVTLDDKPGSVSGTVTDTDDDPLEGVTVNAKVGEDTIDSAETNDQGNYVIDNLSPTIYQLVFIKDGYITGTIENVTVDADTETSDQNIVLQAPVIASVEVFGSDTIVVPSDGVAEISYTAEVKDQNGNVMAGEEVLWDIEDVHVEDEGYILIDDDTGLVTVTSQATVGNNFKVVATSINDSGVSGNLQVTLEDIPPSGRIRILDADPVENKITVQTSEFVNVSGNFGDGWVRIINETQGSELTDGYSPPYNTRSTFTVDEVNVGDIITAKLYNQFEASNRILLDTDSIVVIDPETLPQGSVEIGERITVDTTIFRVITSNYDNMISGYLVVKNEDSSEEFAYDYVTEGFIDFVVSEGFPESGLTDGDVITATLYDEEGGSELDSASTTVIDPATEPVGNVKLTKPIVEEDDEFRVELSGVYNVWDQAYLLLKNETTQEEVERFIDSDYFPNTNWVFGIDHYFSEHGFSTGDIISTTLYNEKSSIMIQLDSDETVVVDLSEDPFFVPWIEAPESVEVNETVEIKWRVENIGVDGTRMITRTEIDPQGILVVHKRQSTFIGAGWAPLSTDQEFTLDKVGTYTFIIDTEDDYYIHKVTVE